MTKNQINNSGELIIYTGNKGGVELRADPSKETIWASEEQIAGIFGIDQSVAGKHIQNILADRELDRKSVCAHFAHTAKDGKQYRVIFYTLDVILAVGYRTNSTKAIKFRQWATKTLREYLLRGVAINADRIKALPDRILRDLEKKINDNTLVALALLIAESDPKEKEVMVALTTNLLV
jgi:hypothetical protein